MFFAVPALSSSPEDGTRAWPRVSVVEYVTAAGSAPRQAPGTFSVSPAPAMVVFKHKGKSAAKKAPFGYGALSQVAPHTLVVHGHAKTQEAAADAARAAAHSAAEGTEGAPEVITVELDLPPCADMAALALAHERAGARADHIMTDIAHPAGAQHAAANVLSPTRACDGWGGTSRFSYAVPRARRELLELRMLAHPHIMGE